MLVVCPECNHEFTYKKQLHDGFLECHYCNELVVRRKADQKFCSDKCRYNYHNRAKGKSVKSLRLMTEVKKDG